MWFSKVKAQNYIKSIAFCCIFLFWIRSSAEILYFCIPWPGRGQIALSPLKWRICGCFVQAPVLQLALRPEWSSPALLRALTSVSLHPLIGRAQGKLHPSISISDWSKWFALSELEPGAILYWWTSTGCCCWNSSDKMLLTGKTITLNPECW